MGFFDDIFGGLFDFDGDGKTTWDEEWIAYKIMQDVEKDLKKEDSSYDAAFLDDDEFEEYMDELEEEFDEAIAEDEFFEEDTPSVAPVTIPLKINLSVEIPTFDSIKASDYPNERTYNAALRKSFLEEGHKNNSLTDSDKRLYKQCDFILSKYKTLIAANYLSSYFGEFLYAQAIKENFTLSFEIPNEDEKRLTSLDDLFVKIFEYNKDLFFPIWKWLIENFVPYMKYSSDNGYNLTNYIIANAKSFSDDFMNEIADFMIKNKSFAKIVMGISPGLDNEYGLLFALLLQKDEVELVVDMFKICIAKDIDEAYINGMLYGFEDACSKFDDPKLTNLFEEHIKPIINMVEAETK